MKKSRIANIFILISFLIFLYTSYRSLIVHEGKLFNFYAPYYALSIIIFFIGVLFFYINQKIQINISISIISIIFSMYLIETALVIPNNSKSNFFEKKTGKIYDKRSRYEVYVDSLKDDSLTALSVPPGYFLEDRDISTFPLSGVSNVNTLDCNENGYFSYFKSDRYGFNNENDQWDKEIIDYLIIGDSFSTASCVFYENGLGGNLSKLTKNGVISLGYPGKGPLTELASLKEYFPKKKVNKVLWVYYEGNDLLDLNSELNNQILLNYLSDENFSQNLINQQTELDLLYREKISQVFDKESIINKKKKFKKISQFLKLFNLRYMLALSLKGKTDLNPDLKSFKKIMKRAKEITKSNNSELYFVYLPRKDSYVGKKRFHSYFYEEVLDLIEDLNIPIIDLYEDFFNNLEDPKSVIPLRERGHFNELGYRLVSNLIYKKIYSFEN